MVCCRNASDVGGRYRKWGSRFVAASLFLTLWASALASTVLGVIGLVDFFSADSIWIRAAGLGFVLLAILLVYFAFSHKKDLALRLFALLAAAIVFASLWSSVDIGSPPQHRPSVMRVVCIVGFVSSVLGAAFTLRGLLRRRSVATEGSDSGHTKGEWIAGAAAVVGAIAVPLAWYTAVFLPSQSAPALSVTSELVEFSTSGAMTTVTAKIVIENTGSTSARILASSYVIAGSSVEEAPAAAGPLDLDRVNSSMTSNFGPSASYNSFSRQSKAELIQFGQLVYDQVAMEPSEITTATVVAVFPSKKFDLVRLATDIIFARTDRLTVDRDAINGPVSDCGGGTKMILSHWDVGFPSTLDYVLSADRQVVVGRVVAEQQQPANTAMWWPRLPLLLHDLRHTDDAVCGGLLSQLDDPTLEDRSMVSMTGSVTEAIVDISRGAAPG